MQPPLIYQLHQCYLLIQKTVTVGWKKGEVEENIILDCARQYEKLNDEEKSELIETAKSAHYEYVQHIMKRVREKQGYE
jgi:biopolymer transport protein ExbD